MLDATYFEGIRGAVYFPSRAYNAWQTWNELNLEEIDRELASGGAAFTPNLCAELKRLGRG